jgi:hypothetical protein
VGRECVWFGGPRNGDFSTDDHWETRGAVMIDPASPGLGGPGAAHFSADAWCEGGSISQAFDMPTYACSEPLYLSLTSQSQCAFCGYAPIDIDINGGRHQFDANATPTQEICLGERAYGGSTTLAIAARASSTSCLTGIEAIVDDIDVYPAALREPMGLDEGEDVVVCAPPGTIVNGDFEEGMPGWYPASEDGAEVGVGYGIGATRGVRLASPSCEAASIRGTASLPMQESTPNPAIEVWVNGAGADPVVVSYGRYALGAVSGVASQTVKLCIPRWAQGVSEPLTFALTSYDLGCPDSRAEYRLDEVKIASDESCDGPVFDGGFEGLAKAQFASSWWRDGEAHATTDLAFEGSASLELQLGELCESARAQQTITVPAGAARPAVRLRYLTADLMGSTLRVQGVPLEPSAEEWGEHVVCLEPETADAPYSLELDLSFDGGACAGSASRAYVDAVEVIESYKGICR